MLCCIAGMGAAADAAEAKLSLEKMLPEDFYSRIGEGKYQRKFYPFFSERKYWESIASSPLKKEAARLLIERADDCLTRPMEALSTWNYFRFVMDGDRLQYELQYFRRRIELGCFVFALCHTGDKAKYLPAVIDRLGAIMAEPFWSLPAHVRVLQDPDEDPMPVPVGAEVVDLFSAETAQTVALTLQILGDEIKAVSSRFYEHCRTVTLNRAVYPVLKWNFWWMGIDTRKKLNNWTPWCTGNVLLAGAILLDDPKQLEALTRRLMIGNSSYYDTIAADGYCDEGPSYWHKSFQKVFCLYRFWNALIPGAAEKLLADPKFRKMGEYKTEVVIAGDDLVTYADSGHIPDRGLESGTIYDFGRSISSANLCARALNRIGNKEQLESTLPVLKSNGRLGSTDQLAVVLDFFCCIPDEFPAESKVELPPVTFWPGRLGIIRHPEGFSASLKSNHNGESHNHNDLGHFSVYYKTRPLVIDLGTGTYSRKNFSNERQSIYYVSAIGHNALCFGDKMQLGGWKHSATLTMPDARTFCADLKNAFPEELNLQKYVRTLTCDADKVVVVDEFQPTAGAFLTLYSPGIVTKASATELDFGDGIRCRLEGAHCESVENVPEQDIPGQWGKQLWKIRIVADGSPLRMNFLKER